jgi:hypothetical protein
MNNALVFLGLAVLICSVAGQRVLLKTIDPFDPDTPSLILVIAEGGLPATLTVSTAGSQILGGERDLQLTAETGPNGRVLTSGVSLGQWDVSTPNGASGFAVMQYDGTDNSPALNRNGLGGRNFMTLGADAVRATIQTDVDTEYTFTFYDTNGNDGDFTITIPAAIDVLTDYTLPFDEFTGNVDFSSIGAIEILIELFANVDSTVSLVGVEGPSTVPPSASPQPQGEGFTWYTVDDDFGRDPCEPQPPRRDYFVDNDNVVYYYFYGYQDDDIDPADLISFESGSYASVIVPSIVSMLAIFTVFF